MIQYDNSGLFLSYHSVPKVTGFAAAPATRPRLREKTKVRNKKFRFFEKAIASDKKRSASFGRAAFFLLE